MWTDEKSVKLPSFLGNFGKLNPYFHQIDSVQWKLEL